jgi:hypothetical protein
MKKNLQLFTVLLIISISLLNCSKNENNIAPLQKKITKEEIINAEKEIGKLISPILNYTGVKKDILIKCVANSKKDYYVKISDILNYYKNSQNSTIARTVNGNSEKIFKLISYLKESNSGKEPILFFPRSETIEYRLNINTEQPNSNYNTRHRSVAPIPNDKIATNSYFQFEQLQFNPYDNEDPGFFIDPSLYGQPGYPQPTEQPIIVTGSTYNPDTELAEGFIFNEQGNMESIGTVCEEYAWENDVFVIGSEDLFPITTVEDIFGSPYLFPLVPNLPLRSEGDPVSMAELFKLLI